LVLRILGRFRNIERGSIHIVAVINRFRASNVELIDRRVSGLDEVPGTTEIETQFTRHVPF
jgi:hypothetical protein